VDDKRSSVRYHNIDLSILPPSKGKPGRRLKVPKLRLIRDRYPKKAITGRNLKLVNRNPIQNIPKKIEST